MKRYWKGLLDKKSGEKKFDTTILNEMAALNCFAYYVIASIFNYKVGKHANGLISLVLPKLEMCATRNFKVSIQPVV